jgi:hypothetical protein
VWSCLSSFDAGKAFGLRGVAMGIGRGDQGVCERAL